MILLAGLLLPVAAASAAPVHVGSYSLSEVHVRGDQVQLQLRCQVLSLGEVIEAFDSDLDGEMEPGELDANRDSIGAYVTDHYRLFPGGRDAEAPKANAASLEPLSVTVTEAPMALDPLNEISEWLDVVVDFSVPDALEFESLGVRMDLFYDTSPQHRDSAAVVWNGLELGAWQFAQGAEAQVFAATDEIIERNVRPAVRFAKAAWASPLRFLDGVLLALLFVVAARRGSRASGLSSAGIFAVLAGVGLVAAPMADLLPQHVRFLELTVPLALGYVGLDDLLHNRGRTRLLETAVFGLALGGREAARLAPELAREATVREPLLGTALGMGAVLIVVALLAAIALGDRSAMSAVEGSAQEEAASAKPGAFSWRPLRLVVDLGAIAFGLWLFWGVFRG
jgi:hypothetical protein